MRLKMCSIFRRTGFPKTIGNPKSLNAAFMPYLYRLKNIRFKVFPVSRNNIIILKQT